MTWRTRAFAGCFVLAMVAAACGGGDDGADTAETTSTTSSTTAPTTTSTTSSSTTVAAPTTTEPVDLGPRYPLTGEPLGDAEQLTTPALVMKIGNNNSTSRASLIGLDHADIVFEERIEANATRFATVFHSDIPDEIGPVRSARTSDVNIVANLNNPIFGYSGSNAGVANQIRAADNDGTLTRVTAETGATPFYRNRSFSIPYNMMVGGPEMLEEAAEDATPPAAIFDYSDNVVEFGVPSAGLELSFRR